MASAETASSVCRILVVDRDPVFRRFVRQQVAPRVAGGIDVMEAASWRDVEADTLPPPGVIVIGTENFNGDAISNIGAAAACAPVIAVSSLGSLNFAVAAMRAGAADFLVRPFRVESLCETIERTVAIDRTQNRGPARTADFERFIGRSETMRRVFEMISRTAPSKAPVFVTGESGTGKELAAEAIHARSGRPGAFVALNCGAIPRELMESEMFGHVRGAFTSAHEDRTGAAEAANGGTLFLDEICEMAPDLQTKLLRFIQTGTLQRVGDARLRSIDVRFVCATNRNPETEIAAGRFRADLYYRLHVLPIRLPPLRERPDDILPLAEAYLGVCCAEEGRGFAGFDPEARALMLSYEWPGNVRQLQNVVRRAVVMNEGREITARMLAMALAHAGQPKAEIASPSPQAGVEIEPFWLQERRIIEAALEACGGNVGQAAAALEISASTIYRKKQGWQAITTAA